MKYFSPHEKDILKIIGRKKLTIGQVTSEFFKEETFEGNNYVAAIIRRIVRKCEHHQLTWTLKGQGAGRSGRTVWREKREAK